MMVDGVRNGVLSIVRSIVFYPISGMWVGGMFIVALVVQEVLTVTGGAIMFGLVAVVMIQMGFHREQMKIHREVKVVHKLVNSQQAELLSWVRQLVNALTDAGVDVPVKSKESGGRSA